ncbi:putative ser arg-related nuclear matrix protein [Eutypa lata UCREL1]|uniref:Putative ser arg-related nuclear matrix protein n=1 Tax=Eutypa lata (strain UCR-EL1) TaxID=1287681 RepID=M7T7A2_EUTLA|nr:putative ser arg-related nuclear matrix protein [Eutypa lata UCREL1]
MTTTTTTTTATTTRDGLPSIPVCPRSRAEAGHVDWLTFPRCDNFNVCPTCYERAFSRGPGARFAHALVPAPFRPSDRPLACDFGRSPWLQLAWLRTLTYSHADLSLFHSVRAVLERARAQDQQECSGLREVYRAWYSIRDPGAGARPVPGFAACGTCARLVETVLPNLTGVFVPLDSEPSLNVCALHPHSSPAEEASGNSRERFVQYLGAFSNVSDAALEARCSPDIQDLADRVGALAAAPECRREVPVRDAWWYVMRSIPEFTVCEACFKEVVAPALPSDNNRQQQQQQDGYSSGNSNGPSVAGDFHYRPQRLALAACQLWSERMHDVFNKAVRRRDLGYLKSRVCERRDREQEY